MLSKEITIDSVNNINLIRPLLSWNNKGEFYYIQILQRRKDGTTIYGNKNGDARLIRAYQIYNLQQFDEIIPDLIKICDATGGRAGINLNKATNKKVIKGLLRSVVDKVCDENYEGVTGILSSVIGAQKHSDKIRIVDIDFKEGEMSIDKQLEYTRLLINKTRPEGEKIITVLPTYSGYHVITTKFDADLFLALCYANGFVPTIQKNNPTALYYPTKTISND